MKTYNIYGNILISEVGKELRRIIKFEKTAFKVLTGYGSKTGVSQSKNAALKSLRKMKKENLIDGYIVGDSLKKLLTDPNSDEYEAKMKYERRLRNDKDYGNPGIIFVFVSK